jgi:hypothetical protein
MSNCSSAIRHVANPPLCLGGFVLPSTTEHLCLLTINQKGGEMARIRKLVAGMAAVVLLAAGVSFTGAQTINNGDMSLGYISGTDTMPSGWGTTPCDASGICMRYDQVEFTSAPASMRLDGVIDRTAVWTQNISGILNKPGNTIELTGMIKITAPSGIMRVAIVRACSGGGYQQLSYHQVVRDDAEGDWYQFTGSVTVPTECSTYPNPTIVIHINPSGAGIVWVDDLVVTCTDCALPVRWDLTDGFMIDNRGVRVEGGDVVFGGNANYDAKLLTTDGRMVAHVIGEGTRISGLGRNLPAGSYVLKVESDRGVLTQPFATR